MAAMRELLAVEAAVVEPSIAAFAIVGVVALVVIVPMIALCGSCDEREPDPGPFDRPGANQTHHQQYPSHHQQHAHYPQQQQPGYGGYPDQRYSQPAGSQYQQPHQYSGHPHQQQYGGHSGYNSGGGQHQYQQPQAQQFSHGQSSQYGAPGYTGQSQSSSQYQSGSQYNQSVPQKQPSQQPHQSSNHMGYDPRMHAQSGGQPGTHLQPADVTLEAVEAVLFQVCDGMKGMIKPGKTLVRETIRTGVSAVIADVTTNYAVDETMMLFPDKNKKSRQMRLYEQLNLKDSMPLVSVDTEIFSHEENGRKVTLPAAIFVNRVKTLGDTLKGMKTIEEKQAELFGIWSQLAKVLKMFHQRGWYLRDVTYDNVVHVRMGATEGWTLLEFGNASRPKSSIAKNTIPARQCPPELAAEMLTANDEKVHLTVAGDMWMLGMLVYQVMTGEPYWKKSLKDSEVLQIMADPRRPLPHKEKPVLNLVQLILESLLHRDPNQRLTSSDLIKRLEQDMATAGAKTINPGPVVDEQPIVLDGT